MSCRDCWFVASRKSNHKERAAYLNLILSNIQMRSHPENESTRNTSCFGVLMILSSLSSVSMETERLVAHQDRTAEEWVTRFLLTPWPTGA